MQGRQDDDATPSGEPESAAALTPDALTLEALAPADASGADASTPDAAGATATQPPEAGVPAEAGAVDAPGDAGPRADTAVSPVIRGSSVSIPTPAWGTAIAVDDTEVIVAELVDDDAEPARRSHAAHPGDPSPTTTTGGIPIPEPAVNRRPVLAALAVAAAIVTIVLHAFAVNVAADRDFGAATTLAWAAIVASFVAIAFGVLAAVFRSGRWTGIVAAVIALFANPWVLLQVLTFFAA